MEASLPLLSSLPRQLVRYMSSRLGALYSSSSPSASLQQPRPAAAAGRSYREEAEHGDEISAAATSVPRGVDVAAARRVGAPPKGRPGQPKEGSGGKINAVLTSTRGVKRGRTPTPPGPPAQGAGGRGGVIHAAAAS